MRGFYAQQKYWQKRVDSNNISSNVTETCLHIFTKYKYPLFTGIHHILSELFFTWNTFSEKVYIWYIHFFLNTVCSYEIWNTLVFIWNTYGTTVLK